MNIIIFIVVAVGFIYFCGWIMERKDMTESSKITICLLVFALIFTVYVFSRGPSSNNRSYLQENCPNCDQP